VFLAAPAVTFAVTTDAKRDQVVHYIATELAPAFYVMDLQAFHGWNRTLGTASLSHTSDLGARVRGFNLFGKHANQAASHED
jgi:hypothetical protein